jgi:tRNA/tmRNA/rRNA uracil-C5-methylase (TrmA/RlmC/RlmD family)
MASSRLQAESIFKHVVCDPDRSVVVLDPPYSGCSDVFIDLLVALFPKRIIYVACGPETQVRRCVCVCVCVCVCAYVPDGEEAKIMI